MERNERVLVDRLATLLKSWDHALATGDTAAAQRLSDEMTAVTATPEFYVALRETSCVRGPALGAVVRERVGEAVVIA